MKCAFFFFFCSQKKFLFPDATNPLLGEFLTTLPSCGRIEQVSIDFGRRPEIRRGLTLLELVGTIIDLGLHILIKLILIIVL